MGLARAARSASASRAARCRPTRRCWLLAGIAAGLDAAHRAGLVHRDVTPGNILLDPAGPWLADFGIARRLDATTVTADGLLVGTAGYLAPEVIAGARASAASDRYGLAAVAFQALAGRPAFEADALAGLLYAHVNRPAPLLSSVRPGLPRAGGRGDGARPLEGARRAAAHRGRGHRRPLPRAARRRRRADPRDGAPAPPPPPSLAHGRRGRGRRAACWSRVARRSP